MIREGGQTGGDMEMQGQGLGIPSIIPLIGGGAGREDTSLQPMRRETQESAFLLFSLNLFVLIITGHFLLLFHFFVCRPILYQPDISLVKWIVPRYKVDTRTSCCLFTWIWFHVGQLETPSPVFRCAEMLQVAVQT